MRQIAKTINAQYGSWKALLFIIIIYFFSIVVIVTPYGLKFKAAKTLVDLQHFFSKQQIHSAIKTYYY